MVKAWLIIAVAVAVAAGTLLPDPAEAFKRLEVGQQATNHTLVTPDGEARQLSDLLGTGATAIAFWASWSPRSREALATLRELRDAYGTRGLAVVSVNAEGPGREPVGDTAMGSDGSVQLVDRDLTLFDTFGVVALPSLVLLDGDGKVAALAAGYSPSSRDEFMARTRHLLGVSTPESTPTRNADSYLPSKEARKYLHRGQLYLRKHKTEKALEMLGMALASDPLYQEARDALVAALHKTGRPDQAVRLQLAAIESDEYCLVPRRNRSANQWQ